jgi:hypothetical protein
MSIEYFIDDNKIAKIDIYELKIMKFLLENDKVKLSKKQREQMSEIVYFFDNLDNEKEGKKE